jgi:hypothetical protein
MRRGERGGMPRSCVNVGSVESAALFIAVCYLFSINLPNVSKNISALHS